jgi:glycerol-3-phosphate acyltransferase PlsY
VDIVVCLATAGASYLLGSIPSGYLAGLAKGIDIRKTGSGNIGATNAFRVLGRAAGTAVLAVDALKGFIAVALVPGLAAALLPHTGWSGSVDGREDLKILAALSVILGHNYTCWLRFKGGKGIATSGGVLAALIPATFAIGLGVWIIVCLLTRYVSVASIAAAIALPIATWGVGGSPRMITITAVMMVLAIYKHRGNLQRLRNGTENRIGAKKGAPPAGSAV